MRVRPDRETQPAEISTHNLGVYRGRLLSWWFKRRTDLFAPEVSILERLGPGLRGAEVLDIGVGGGRTTAHLVRLGLKYTGIDYSPQMIARCRTRYPAQTFEVCDARDLSRFAAGRFDLVFFSFNGIDYVSHVERLRVLEEIRRVLSRRGALVFSSHNREFKALQRPWALSHLPLRVNPFTNPLKFAAKAASYPVGIVNHLANRNAEWQGADYAILNDAANNYQMLTYCISVEKQIVQLREAAYDAVEVIGFDGRWLSASEYCGCTTDPYLYYICRH
jgi:SAM-dependent methyltransferase